MEPKPISRAWIARGFTVVEDIVYIGLGVLLAASAIALLFDGSITFVQNIVAGVLTQNIITLLNRILLIMLVVELLYTLQVSFREHTVAPEPFLLVGVIAAIRRVLLLTAEFGHLPVATDGMFRRFITELVALTADPGVGDFAILLRKSPVVPEQH
jgi:uncharacterized membrane protein (DUF373 family)